MRVIQNFEDYSLDLLVEAITQKEIPILFSDRFKSLLGKIDHPITDKLLSSERKGEESKSSFIDLDDSDLDKVSFITSTKAAEVLADQRGIGKDEEINFSRQAFVDARYDSRINDKLFSKFRSVTTIGKLINKLYPKEFVPSGKPGEDIQSFTDQFKAMRDTKDLEEVNGYDIVTYYNSDSYIDGEDTSGTLGNSCMRYEECGEYVQFYADNPKVCSLLILKDEEGDKIRGRALVWKLSRPEDRVFMDRIYTVDSYDEELFKSYAKKNGWLYKVRQNSSDGEYIMDTKDDTKEYKTLIVRNVNDSSTDKYPYMDTLKYYYSEDGILSNDSDRGGEKWTLESTDGEYESENGQWVEYYGQSYPEDDLIYCEMGDDYRLEDDAIWNDFYDEYMTEEYRDRNMEQCDYYDGYCEYRKPQDTVSVYGSDEVACSDYAANNMVYSDYHGDYLPEGESVYSHHHESDLWEREAVEVYTDAEQSDTDWRAEDDDTWWEWNEDGEKYDNNVTEDELKEFNGIEDEDENEDEEGK
jgi:hypothetical protein